MTKWRSKRDGKQWRNSSMGERATLSPAPEVFEWRNIVLGEHDAACVVTDAKCGVSCDAVKWRNTILGGVNTARDQIGVLVPKCMTERSELEGSRAERAWILQCERSERFTS